MKTLRPRDRCNCEQSLAAVRMLKDCLKFWRRSSVKDVPTANFFKELVSFVDWSEYPSQQEEELELAEWEP